MPFRLGEPVVDAIGRHSHSAFSGMILSWQQNEHGSGWLAGDH